MNRVLDMTEGKPLRLVLRLALPLMLTNIGQQLYMIVDAAIVGRGVGVKALAAVGSVDWCYWLILWTVMGITQGFAIVVSTNFGRRDYARMNHAIAMACLLCAATGILLTVAGLLAARPLLELLKSPADIIDDAAVYLMTMIAGTLIVTAYNMAGCILRAFGNGRAPLTAMAIAGVLNIGLDLLFVLVFRWGVFGAALASVLAQLVSFLYCLVQILRISYVHIEKAQWRPDKAMCLGMIRLALPIALKFIVIALSGIILQSTVNAQGSIFVAGFTATNKLYGLLECTAIAMGQAFATFFSQNRGAGEYRRIRNGARAGVVLCAGMAAIVMAIVIPSGQYLLQLFLDTGQAEGVQALSIAYHYLFIMAVCLFVLYLIHVYRDGLQAIGSTSKAMVSGFAESAARVLMAKVAVAYLGVEALFYAEPVSWLAALLLAVFPFYADLRKPGTLAGRRKEN